MLLSTIKKEAAYFNMSSELARLLLQLKPFIW